MTTTRSNGRGGSRPGAGRPARNPLRPSERHQARIFDPRHPVRATARTVEGLPSLREPRLTRAILQVLRERVRAGRVRVVHHAIATDRVEVTVEADDRTALLRGLQGLFVALARAVNRALDRKGNVFSDRYRAVSVK